MLVGKTCIYYGTSYAFTFVVSLKTAEVSGTAAGGFRVYGRTGFVVVGRCDDETTGDMERFLISTNNKHQTTTTIHNHRKLW